MLNTEKMLIILILIISTSLIIKLKIIHQTNREKYILLNKKLDYET